MFFCGFSGGAVRAHRPGDHVSHEGVEGCHTEDHHHGVAKSGAANDDFEGIHDSRNQAKLFKGNCHENADRAEHVEHGDQGTRDDDGAGDIFAGVLHFARSAGHQFKAHEVVDDDRQESQTGIPRGENGFKGQVVCHAVFACKDEGTHTDNHHDQSLDDSADIGNPLAGFHFHAAKQDGQPSHQYADGNLPPEAHFREEELSKHASEKDVNRGHPQRHVDPV